MTSPVKLVGRTRYRAQFQASSFHLDSGNWPGDEAGSHCFKLRRMVKGTESIEDIHVSPANEAEGQNTTRASRTKLLENERDSETSTARDRVKHRCGCRRYRPRNFLFLASRGIYGFRKCPENEEVSKSKLEQHNRHNTNAADEIITAV